jgi:hypothetical protein
MEIEKKYSELVARVELKKDRAQFTLRNGETYSFPSGSLSKKAYKTISKSILHEAEERYEKVKNGQRKEYSLGKFFNALRKQY